MAITAILAAAGIIYATTAGERRPITKSPPAAPDHTRAAGTPATASPANLSAPIPPSSNAAPAPGLAWPISDALSRVTKKPFGIYVSPGHSPVSPERFTGYHTGADFETTPAEQNIDVPVFAICDGKILAARYASGYGGVIVESCTMDNGPVTVIYGHVRQSSIIPTAGQIIKAGDKLAVLGTGYSSETDGERKHLHLGIHKGTSIDILGYVQNKAALSGWIDPLSVLK